MYPSTRVFSVTMKVFVIMMLLCETSILRFV